MREFAGKWGGLKMSMSVRQLVTLNDQKGPTRTIGTTGSEMGFDVVFGLPPKIGEYAFFFRSFAIFYRALSSL